MSTNASPFFSIVTVVLNDLAGLKSTQASLGRQICTDYEWIVIDGRATEEVANYLVSLGHLPLTWISEKDRGIYDAMNKGVSKAIGRYVVFMNAGDEFSNEDALLKISNCLKAATMPDLCFAGCDIRFPGGRKFYRRPKLIAKSISHGLPAVHQATFYKRTTMLAPAYDLKYKISGDYYIAATYFAKSATACYLHERIAVFNTGGVSTRYTLKSLRECWSIQGDILNLSLGRRLMSLARRFLAHRTLQLLHVFPTCSPRTSAPGPCSGPSINTGSRKS